MGRMGRPVLDGESARVTVAGVDPVTGTGCAWSAGVFSGPFARAARVACETQAALLVAPGLVVECSADTVAGAMAAIEVAVGANVRWVGDVPPADRDATVPVGERVRLGPVIRRYAFGYAPTSAGMWAHV